ncbi:MAG: 3-hydroxybutyryl-CoA dehydrogenase [Phycisphaerae bacterium]|nr:3-hydroxyacyl-CoA dehydrogenase NAD-binding domain-containing protein [Phycisphaerae bacterium]NUQ44986.1 3-hydroxybutyryl-CoA dehydrogenase [Phycisphaerae bacterium]
MNIDSIVVIGSGTMGRGIAQVAATCGLDVWLHDAVATQLAGAAGQIEKDLGRLVEKGKLTADQAAAARKRLTIAESLDSVPWKKIGLAIEAIFEDFDAKKALYAALEPRLPADAILASNTSSISITKLAAATRRVPRFIGMHFFNPVPVMALVEIIRGLNTADETKQTIEALAKKMGKTPLHVNDMPGFVSNRVLMPLINEAAFCVMEHVADPVTIDQVMQLGCAHTMGPLATADLIGIDVCVHIMEVLQRELGDPKFRPCPLLRTMVHAGRLGRKSGRGFFEYPAKK